MSTLKEKAEEILTEKNEKILPENIKKGVQIFDITGTLDNKPVVPSFMNFYLSSDLINYRILDALNPDNPVPSEYYIPIINTCINGLDYSQATSFESMFYMFKTDDYSNINIELDTSSGKYFGGMFEESGFVSAPNLNLNNAVSLSLMFNNCENLENVPQYQIHTSLDDFNEPAEEMDKTVAEYLADNFVNDIFSKCPNLSDESLNNILGMISDDDFPMNKVQPPRAHWKTLVSTIGLTQEQAYKCTQLSNWEAAVEKGWEVRQPEN